MSRFSAAASPAAAWRGSCAWKRRVCACWSLEKRPHPVPEAAFKVGESSVEIGAHYFQKRLGLEPHLRDRTARKARAPVFFSARRQPRPRRAGRARTAALSAGAVVPARSRPARELLLATDADDGRRGARRLPCSGESRWTGARASPHRSRRRRARATVYGALGRGRQRPRRAAEAAARAAPSEPARRQRRVVPLQRRASRSTTGPTIRRGRRACRRGLALAQHQSPDGRRLLGLADSARLRQHQLRDRRRRRRCIRSRASTGSSARSTGCASSSRSAPRSMEAHAARARGLPRAAALRARLRARVLARSAGRSSAKRACSPIRSTRPARTSSPWATTTSPI